MDAAYYMRDFSLLLQDVCNIIETSVREFNDYHVTSNAFIGASGVVLLGSEALLSPSYSRWILETGCQEHLQYVRKSRLVSHVCLNIYGGLVANTRKPLIIISNIMQFWKLIRKLTMPTLG
jgi:hypothetical protein